MNLTIKPYQTHCFFSHLPEVWPGRPHRTSLCSLCWVRGSCQCLRCYGCSDYPRLMGSKQVPDELLKEVIFVKDVSHGNPMMLMVLQVGALLEARACVDALAQKGQGLRNGPFFLEAYLLVTEKSRKSPEKKMLWMWRANDFLHMPITDCLKESLLWCSLRRNLRDVLGSVREIGWKRFAFDEIVQYLVQVRKKVSLDSKNTQWPYQCIFQLSHKISWTYENHVMFLNKVLQFNWNL